MVKPIIHTEDLTKSYGDVVGLDGLDLEVRPGEVFGFLGPNGSGKTTTIRLLLDLIRPSRGKARLFDRSTGVPGVRARVGYLPGDLVLDERLTGWQTLDFFASLTPGALSENRRARRSELAERLDLSGADLDRRVREYSRGMKQKLGLLTALEHDPDLLILDEPTTTLDPLAREAVFDLLMEAGANGKTVFHSSHILTEVERTCTRTGILRRGRLVALRRIDELRQKSSRKMVVRFSHPVPESEFRLPGVEIIEQDGTRIVLRVTGELDPLLKLLARHSVRQLSLPEPSLEEAFLEFYRGNERGHG